MHNDRFETQSLSEQFGGFPKVKSAVSDAPSTQVEVHGLFDNSGMGGSWNDALITEARVQRQRAEKAEEIAHRLALDALVALSGAGYCTPAEGYEKAPHLLRGDIERALREAKASSELPIDGTIPTGVTPAKRLVKLTLTAFDKDGNRLHSWDNYVLEEGGDDGD